MALIYKIKGSEISKKLEVSALDDTYLFIIGGDGTYLRALSNFKQDEIPKVYAFNDGKVGFLLPINKDRFDMVYEKIIRNQLEFITRYRMKLESHNLLFCNEMVIRSKEFKLNIFQIQIDDFKFELRASEIVIASSFGSTGYSLSLGGPMIFSNSFVLNCSAPNRCSFNPVVLSDSSIVSISSEGCSGWIDGQEVEGNVFIVRKGDEYNVYVEDMYCQYSAISKILESSVWETFKSKSAEDQK